MMIPACFALAFAPPQSFSLLRGCVEGRTHLQAMDQELLRKIEGLDEEAKLKIKALAPMPHKAPLPP